MTQRSSVGSVRVTEDGDGVGREVAGRAGASPVVASTAAATAATAATTAMTRVLMGSTLRGGRAVAQGRRSRPLRDP
ncbi:hypothetical protein GCM10009606_18490 [Nocardioides aquiterrae]|uniref:Uncharacterized protein n=1 Tax=Nocardioides aquiterrae TaxID=203799 RepID=A0ABN1UCA1_9ACTN